MMVTMIIVMMTMAMTIMTTSLLPMITMMLAKIEICLLRQSTMSSSREPKFKNLRWSCASG